MMDYEIDWYRSPHPEEIAEALLKNETPFNCEVLFFTLEDASIFEHYYEVNKQLRKLFRGSRRSYLNERIYMTPDLLDQMNALPKDTSLACVDIRDHFHDQFIPHLQRLSDGGYPVFCICR